ncbi:peptide alpha-N-acetyltransferase subunit NAT5 KNAG_0G02670 [Huiozyma naganishii CBS 8797]|uniref:N-acetyltransferase domain-containing protein n=1 Tax=Huiozyma naganishii (strain ATCC MYA-139 / BCRC 22969 / CBS 8797 / KCTC 17520 / NBRC 10181 / NCYC 3082 / Yp74L-3) TaxID=1071383 RepID=J7RNW8_HUIN7|nr:hypothetical protein KNAG_0G02670 [Kazachstania naganishii CBS 8797]CCK71323.1 hypothetical protein KNAG_0G02670 [Kazachstania naganishii CBS 8797]
MSVAIDNVYSNNEGMFAKLCSACNSSGAGVAGSAAGRDSIQQIVYFGEVPVGALQTTLQQKKRSAEVPKGQQINLLAVLPAYSKKPEIREQMLQWVETQCTKNHQHLVYVQLDDTAEEQLHEWYTTQGFQRNPETPTLYEKQL